MSVGTTAAIVGLVGAGIGAAGSITSSIINKSATSDATKAITGAANQISALEGTAGTKATQDVNDATDKANTTLQGSQDKVGQLLEPYMSGGTDSLTAIQGLLGQGGAVGTPFNYDSSTYQNDPQYAFIRDQANQALARSAAAKGGLVTGGFARESGALNTSLTNTFLGDAYNRALSTWQANRQSALDKLSGYQNLLGTGLTATNYDTNAILGTNTGIANNTIGAGTFAGTTALHTADEMASALGAGANATAASSKANAATDSNLISGLTQSGLDALYGIKTAATPSGATTPTPTPNGGDAGAANEPGPGDLVGYSYP